MTDSKTLAEEHRDLTRRFFLQLGAVGTAGLGMSPLWAQGAEADDALAQAIDQLEYLTKPEDFRVFGRGKPKPHTLPAETLREVGLHRDTWQMEVVADPESDSQLDNPLSKELGNALDFAGLMEIAKTKAVRFMKVMTCTNGPHPCGMGLWEGVPLRDVVWMAKPTANIRRLFYYGFHNDDPEQRFQGSLPIGRVLEDPPGEHPVILCYKLNDEWLSPASGAPVRMIVPDAYGNKSVKWLQRIVLTNIPQQNDTYAEWNNDTVSHMKTQARFLNLPKTAKSGAPLPITGLAQVGMAGLEKVQYCIMPQNAPKEANDPYFAGADWQDAQLLPPPEHWGGDLPGGKLPPVPAQIGPDGKPHVWPLRDTIVHWAALVEPLSPGKHVLRCRTIDAAGTAQPMPRPFPKSGNNRIHTEVITVEA